MLVLTQVLLGLALQTPASGDAVVLRHKFVSGDIQTYSIVRTVTGQLQEGDLVSWIPFRIINSETYTVKVLTIAPAGTADVYYEAREKIHYSQMGDNPAEDVDSGKDWLVLTLSSTNQVLKDFDRPKKPKPGDKKPPDEDEPPDEGDGMIVATTTVAAQGSSLTTYLFRSLMSAVQFNELFDFGPKLPYYPVKVGDTWMGTISALPGQAAGTAKSSQRRPGSTRVDITYRFDGLKDRNKAKVWAIHGSYSADLDLKPTILQGAPDFVLQLNPITAATIKVKGDVDFYVDPKTGNMLYAEATSSAEGLIEAPETFTMLRNAIKLTGSAVVKPIPTPPSTSNPKPRRRSG